MGFQDAIRICFRKYVTFSGRAARSEFWYFTLFLFAANMVLSIFDSILFTSAADDASILSGLFSLATFLPSLAVGARRLHDLDKSGWWLLLYLIPVIGWIILIVWFVGRGTMGSNRFGPDPLGPDGEFHHMAG